MTKELRNTRSNKLASAAFVLGSALALQGCVAAAFPLAAGGLLGDRSISKDDSDANLPNPTVQVATSGDEGEVVNSDLAPVRTEPAPASPPASSASADFNAAFANNAQVGDPVSISAATPEPIARPESELAAAPASTISPASSISSAPEPPVQTAVQIPAPTNRIVRPLPTPVPSAREPLTAPISSATTAPVSAAADNPAPAPGFASSSVLGPPSGVNQFLSYANQRQIGTEDEPEAAVLSNRVTLEPVKAQCGGVSPTILIDLDPEGALFDSTTASRPPSGLARGLAQLRESGVSVAWISGNGIDKLDAIKRSLTYSGLDLANEDRVLLVRGSDDRKQTLREELSQISCLIAIAGDTRSDFDELYDYLKNPSDANSLEPLIGDGWFLIPQPLL
ncbi:MAG: hypothetical protein ABJ205_10285 [Erythrobacter sp.]|uniref:hypothetical protein n=1 Tax=Erythrobacter sp. TaxID=1042 RepID=UPI003262EF89